MHYKSKVRFILQKRKYSGQSNRLYKMRDKVLQKQGAKLLPLHEAIIHNNVQSIKGLMQKGAKLHRSAFANLTAAEKARMLEPFYTLFSENPEKISQLLEYFGHSVFHDTTRSIGYLQKQGINPKQLSDHDCKMLNTLLVCSVKYYETYFYKKLGTWRAALRDYAALNKTAKSDFDNKYSLPRQDTRVESKKTEKNSISDYIRSILKTILTPCPQSQILIRTACAIKS